jgi:Uma2 family endonuclease
MAVLAPTNRRPMSREEYDRLKEGPPFYDYVHGEAVLAERPSVEHQQIVMVLVGTLDRFVEAHKLGLVVAGVGVELPTGDVIGPDVVFVRRERLDIYDREKGDIVGTPDLIVEVLSPSTAAYDRSDKLTGYRNAGVPWVWIIDQDTLILEEYRWTQDGYRLNRTCRPDVPFIHELFPGLELTLSSLFPLA